MDENQTYIVSRLKAFLIDHYSPEMIILYGSTARGDTDEFSDIDMMVIMDAENIEKLTAEILANTDHIVHEKHILIRSSYDYYNQRNIPGTMVYSALSEGLVLYLNPGFNADTVPLTNYEERKRDVIEKDYLAQACGFLKKAGKTLENNQLFRCRDFLRFAAVRALKAVIVFRDVHPPRSADLEVVYEKARKLFPAIDKLQKPVAEIKNYCPAGDNPEDVISCREIAEKTSLVVDSIAFLLCKFNDHQCSRGNDDTTGGHTGTSLQ